MRSCLPLLLAFAACEGRSPPAWTTKTGFLERGLFSGRRFCGSGTTDVDARRELAKVLQRFSVALAGQEGMLAHQLHDELGKVVSFEHIAARWTSPDGSSQRALAALTLEEAGAAIEAFPWIAPAARAQLQSRLRPAFDELALQGRLDD